MRDDDYKRAVEEAARLGAKIDAIAQVRFQSWYRWDTQLCPLDWDLYDYRVAPPEPAKPSAWWLDFNTGRFYSCAENLSQPKNFRKVSEALP